MSSVISTTNFTKKFLSSEAIHDLNLEVPEASNFDYIGPNGAGKTTTIKNLMNIFVPSSGSARVLGLDSRRLSPARLRKIGYVFENQALPGWMSVDYFLDYCAFYPNWDPALCDALVKQFDLLRKQKLKQLSRGMRMKAALVSAIAYRPQLLSTSLSAGSTRSSATNSWKPDTTSAVVRFIVTDYVDDTTPQQVRTIFPACRDLSIQPMSLRSIFVNLAKSCRHIESTVTQ